MRILFIAMPNSVHTARWINQLASQKYDIHLFPSTTAASKLPSINIKVHFAGMFSRIIARLALAGLRRIRRLLNILQEKPVPAIFDRSFWLSVVIRITKPDIIHSLEIQHAGYLTLSTRKRLGKKFPTWIVTNWGSDIYLYGRLAKHVDRVKAVLTECDYYSCECQRDVQLAKDYGLKGKVLPVLPNSSGFDLDRVYCFKKPGPTSTRRMILLKGYQGWVGRALVGLRAIELCTDVLNGYRVAIYFAREDVAIAAELVSQATGIPIELIPSCSHDEMLRIFGSARIYIGLSISDAIPTSLLESLVMGAFPIQSCTSCAGEWVEHGKTGFIVPPEDPEIVAEAIRRAVTDDALVDFAAEENIKVAKRRLNQSVIKPQVIAMYEKVFTEGSFNLKQR